MGIDGDRTGDEDRLVSLKDCCPGCGEAGISRCARCKRVKYCGSRCQKEHWRLHKVVCGEKAKLRPPPASSTYQGPVAAATCAYGEDEREGSSADTANQLLAMMADPSVALENKTRCFAADGPFASIDATVFAAGERCSPSVYEVAITMFQEDEKELRKASLSAPYELMVIRSRYAAAIMTPGALERGDGDSGYRAESQRRAAALFANGGFLPFMRAVRAVAEWGLEWTATKPGPGGVPWCEASMTVPPMMMPREVEDARELLRWLCQVLSSEAVGHAALTSAPWDEVLEELQALVDDLMEHEGDANTVLESLVYTTLGHLDYWAQLPGLLVPEPRDLKAELELSDLQERMFDAQARPCSRAQIARGSRLSADECRQITLAHYYLLGQFMCDMDMLT